MRPFRLPAPRRLTVFCCAMLVAVLAAFGVRAQSRTSYTCAVRAVKALGTDYPAFVRLVHPVKGLVYTESGRTLGAEKPFSAAALLARSMRVSITASYNDAEIDSVVNLRRYLQGILQAHPFAKTKDIRRNITGLDHSTDVFRKARPGETLLSFHLIDPANELAWRCLVVRTEMYRGQAWVTGLDYLYWTP